MARQAQDGDSLGTALSITISGTDRYSLYGAFTDRDVTSQIDTIVYGSGNTVYDLGVDETSRIEGPTAAAFDSQFEIHEFFDGDHPSNATVSVTATQTGSARMIHGIVQYDDADQTDGYRGTAVTTTAGNLSGDAWDLSPSSDSGDQETVGFCFSNRNNNTHAPDADNPEIVDEAALENVQGANACKGVIVADTTSRGTLGGDWSDNRGYGAWGASILPASAGGGAQTVNVSAAAIPLLGVATDVATGAVSRALNAATTALTAPAPSPATGAVSRSIDSAKVPLSGPQPTRQTGAVSRNIDAGQLPLTGPAPARSVGAVSRSIDAAIARIVGPAPSPTTGAVSRGIDAALLPLIGVGPTRSVGVSVALDAAPLPIIGPAPSRTVGAVSRSVDAAIARLVGPAPTPTTGAVSRSVNAAAVALIGQAVDASVGAAGAQTVNISSAGVAFIGPQVAKSVGAVSRTLAEAKVPLTAPQPTTSTAIAVTVDPATLALVSAAVGREVGAVTLDLGAAAIPLIGVDVSPATGAVSRSLDVAKIVLVSPEVSTTIATGQSIEVAAAMIGVEAPEPRAAWAEIYYGGPLSATVP